MRLIKQVTFLGVLAQVSFAQKCRQKPVPLESFKVDKSRDSRTASIGVKLSRDSEQVYFKKLEKVTSNGYAGSSVSYDRSTGKKNLLTANFLILDDTSIFGSIVDETNSIVHRISPDYEGNLMVDSILTSDFPDEADPLEVAGELGDQENRDQTSTSDVHHDHRALGATEDCGGYMDVMVVWTKKAECANSGLPAGCGLTSTTHINMMGLIKLAVQETNTAFEKSGVNAQLRLVKAYRDNDYDESLGYISALNALRVNGDGAMDHVHSKREQYGADLVALIINNPQYCGMAYLGPSKDLMFSATNYFCATGYFAFGHEIGHNLGCNHDKGTKNACANSSYNYGWRDPDGQFRSILAYNCKMNECDDIPTNSCTKVQRFSNPFYGYNGKPIGDSETDNARQINNVRPIVADYYECLCDEICPEGFDDGANCYMGKCPWGSTPFVWSNRLYCTPIPNCPLGSYDGANCFIGHYPPFSAPFIWSGNLYYHRIGGTCSVPGTWYDGAHCFVAPGSMNPFVWGSGLYVQPTPGTTCPLGTFDGANCLVYDPPPGSAPFIWGNGGLYYEYASCEKTRPPTSAPTGGGGSCMSGDTAVLTREKISIGKENQVTTVKKFSRAKDLKVGDYVIGLDGRGPRSVCTMEAVGTLGFGPLYGNYTDDHFVYLPANSTDEKGKVIMHGQKGVLKNETKYEVLTSCPLGLDSSGTGFTPIDGDFCSGETLGWSDYVALHTAILSVVWKTGRGGRLFFSMSSYTNVDDMLDFAPKMCAGMLMCAKENRCDSVEEASLTFVTFLNDDLQEIVKKAFPNIGNVGKPGSLSSTIMGCSDDKDCNDQNECTKDMCNRKGVGTTRGVCSNIRIKGCCRLDNHCDDQNSCTYDYCQDNQCTHVPNKVCKECKYDKECDDQNVCTADTCAEGSCLNVALPGCRPCTTARECNDNNVCTTDTCPTTGGFGTCVHAAICGCEYCKGSKDCDDGNVCTEDSCSKGQCTHKAITDCCRSNFDCTNRGCHTSECSDANKCVETEKHTCTNKICFTSSCSNDECKYKKIKECKCLKKGKKCFYKRQPCCHGFFCSNTTGKCTAKTGWV